MEFPTRNFELSANDLSAVRGERLLFKQLNFSLKSGGVLHLQGANGTGKTTLLRMLCGLSKPYSGVINWCGNNINDLAEEFREHVLYIGHLPSIKEDLTALENLQFSLALTGDRFDLAKASNALKMLGLAKGLHLPTRVLSQGQKRRVALARLWLQHMPLWILDEPFTALDVSATQLLRQKIEQFANDGGLVVMTSHQTFSMNVPNFVQLQLDANVNVNGVINLDEVKN